MLKVDQLPRNQRKESWRKKKEEMEVSQRQAVSALFTFYKKQDYFVHSSLSKEVLVWFLFVSLLVFRCLFISFRFTSFGSFVCDALLFFLSFCSLQRSPRFVSFRFTSCPFLSFHLISFHVCLFCLCCTSFSWFRLRFHLVSSLYLRLLTVLNTNIRDLE